ncbi:unnamed protein product [Sphagnum jensenii]|uniref:Uncharacterized protein n=1 Tax=Sphagnum jensenii TaxID=128206 RepID=A0ABP0XAP7_9BRYO
MSLEFPSPAISRRPAPPPLGTTMSTKDTAVRRAEQQEMSSQPPSQVVGSKTASHLLGQVVGIRFLNSEFGRLNLVLGLLWCNRTEF